MPARSGEMGRAMAGVSRGGGATCNRRRLMSRGEHPLTGGAHAAGRDTGSQMAQTEKKISRARKERATTVAKDTASPVPGTAAVRRSRRGVVTALMGMARGKASTFVDELGRIFGLMFAVLVRIPRRPWRPRAIAEQVWFVASVTLFPALLLTLRSGLVIGLQEYNTTRQFRPKSAKGAAMVLAIVGEA